MTDCVDLAICDDCLFVLAYDDATAFDFHYSEVEAAARLADVYAGAERLGGYIAFGDPDRGQEFSRSPCDCCLSPLHGRRHHATVEQAA